MSLILSQQAIGAGWEIAQIGDIAGPLWQWYRLDTKRWEPLPLGVEGLPCRFGNLWRRPTVWQTKFSAAWAARGNLFARYILRRTT